MESNRLKAQRLRPLAALLAVGGLAILPTPAFAAEGENVVLAFDKAGQTTVWAAFAVGLLTLLYGLFFLRPFVLRQSPGDARMTDVGMAIREGAVAYLKSQIATMAPLIVLLFAGLVGLYWRLGPTTAFGVGACFVAGVVASYVSGATGMLIAVQGNMRTANAALTGYKKALIVAFRSGAVAGMVTVGIGLMGASAIVGLFPKVATSLLVGFAFGASLAALFMRVGGGIFTKAADVGADLVGKVEAGIPEDDPRNPATIADNVGDNVGDCAGMAADVFESYEVTLIAAIVLGAATAAVFDAQTWPRLIVFGLAVSAIGLVASALGVQLVSSKDDPESDPLKSLKRGFYIAVGATLAGVFGLAALTMNGIQTARLRPLASYLQEDTRTLRNVRAEIAKRTGKKENEVEIAEVTKDPRVQALGLGDKQDERVASGLLGLSLRPEASLPNFAGYQAVDLTKPDQPFLDYAVQTQGDPTNPTPGYASIRSIVDAQGDKKLVVAKVHVKVTLPAQPAAGPGQPATAEQKIDRDAFLGPLTVGDLNKNIAAITERFKQSKGEFKLVESYPVRLFASPEGGLAYGVDAPVTRPWEITFQPSYYSKATVSEMQAPAPNAPQPEPIPLSFGIVERSPVPWVSFALCIAFGIALALAIEWITDHFVSTHKGPTQEVAGVATAGAAPMVIQGFAHALTSSVYMVVAIGIGLMFPMLVFNPATYGGYTLSFYGIALVGIGILTTTGYVLAMDTFGPISDNAQGVFEMSGVGHESPSGAHIVARLDAAGNTTKALTKGFAIATAVIAAVALFHSFLEGARLSGVGIRLDVPEIFVGLLLGAAAPFLFCAFTIDAVGRASFDLIGEVRRQFKADPGIMAGTSKPDYARCVAIVTKAAQKELLAPGVLAITLPIAIGFGFSIGKPATTVGDGSYVLTGAQALGGFLAGAIASGQLMAVLLANAGGMWDNAKKLIEDGLHGGKGTDAHKAAVVGDTIGDPFKDTAGPALNPLIKVMNLIAVLISAIIIQPLPVAVTGGVTAVCVVALIASIALAKKGSMSTALQAATAGAASADHAFTHSPLEGGAPTIAPTVASAVPPAPEQPAKRKLFVDDDEQG